LSFCLVATPPTSSSVNEGAFGAVNRDTPNPVIPVNPWYTLTSFTYARVQRPENPWPSRKRVDAATSVLWWEAAVVKWAGYLSFAPADDRWVPLAKAHQASCQRRVDQAKKAAQRLAKGRKRVTVDGDDGDRGDIRKRPTTPVQPGNPPFKLSPFPPGPPTP